MAMSWWKTHPASSSVSPPKDQSPAGAGLFRSRSQQPQPQTGRRRRRLRRPCGLAVKPAGGFRWFGGSAKSPDRDEASAATSDEAESPPLPLPVPDLASLLRWEPEVVDGPRRKERSNGSSSGSNLSSPLTHRRHDLVNELKSSTSPSSNDLKTQLERTDYRIDVPARSAPISKSSSPVPSPGMISSRDNLSSSSSTSQTIRSYWSSPELPTSTTDGATTADKSIGFNKNFMALNYNTISKTSDSSGETTRLNSYRSLESSSWHDQGLVRVHPLPLPPGPSMPSLSTFLQLSSPVLEAQPMKSQWQKGKLIGRGTFGNVYVATNKETGALCAMKEVNLIPDDPKSAECMMQLEQEIKVLSQLKHPNIVQYYGSEMVEDHFYIYLEYIHPGSISKYAHEHCGALTESVVRNFTRHILSGLAYLHSKQTIHRDIKGANLLVDASGVVKLADFGMAKHLSGQVAALSMRGSPYWMAPEVMEAMMKKDTGYDSAVDIWSLGCTIIEMLTGKPPWNEYEGAAAMFKVLKNESPPVPANLSAEGKDFLQLCFRRNPSERPSANALLEHRFLRNFSQVQENSGYINEFSCMRLTGIEAPSCEWHGSSQTGNDRPIQNWWNLVI